MEGEEELPPKLLSPTSLQICLAAFSRETMAGEEEEKMEEETLTDDVVEKGDADVGTALVSCVSLPLDSAVDEDICRMSLRDSRCPVSSRGGSTTGIGICGLLFLLCRCPHCDECRWSK